jgi:hypothetical protein
MFQRPTRAARLKHDGVSTQFVNRDLHRRPRAQAWIEKDERDGLAGQRLRLIPARLDSKRRLDEPIDFDR